MYKDYYGMNYWHGEPIAEMPREKLLEIIDALGKEVGRFHSSENIRIRALGRVELIKGELK